MKDSAFATSPREFDLPYSTTLEEIMQKLNARRAAFQMPFQIKGGVPGVWLRERRLFCCGGKEGARGGRFAARVAGWRPQGACLLAAQGPCGHRQRRAGAFPACPWVPRNGSG